MHIITGNSSTLFTLSTIPHNRDTERCLHIIITDLSTILIQNNVCINYLI